MYESIIAWSLTKYVGNRRQKNVIKEHKMLLKPKRRLRNCVNKNKSEGAICGTVKCIVRNVVLMICA